jgi:SAM-dependent methyltransferase
MDQVTPDLTAVGARGSWAQRLSRFNRERKWRIFAREFAITSRTRVLDVGFTEIEYSATDNYLERNYPYPRQITALGLEEPRRFALRYPQVRALKYDGSRFPFDDKSFDVVWSNAVIEHVGDRGRQLGFLRELLRVASGVFFTTPNRWFPVEVHTRTPVVHYLPKASFNVYLRAVGKEWATGEYMNLLGRGDLTALLDAAPVPAQCRRIYSNRLCGFALDFAVAVHT